MLSSSVLLFFSFSGSEIMLILFVALILFGGDKFPEIARGLGKGIREFKDMSDGVKREIHSQINNYDQEPRPKAPQITETIQPGTENFPEHESRDIDMPVHDTANLPVADAAATHDDPITTVTPHEPVAEKPVLPKPDFTPPANTISHQSY